MSCSKSMSSKTGGLYQSVYLNPKKAELGFAEGGSGTVDHRNGSYKLHSWSWPQSSRALGGFDPWWSGKGFAWGTVSHH